MQKIALCIGNNHFTHFPGNSLQGCINDANDAAAFLKSKGFSASILCDAAEVDAKAALQALKPDGAWPENARIVIWVSSHGSQIADPFTLTEGDGLLEVTVCADFDGEKGCIEDKWWADFLADIPASTRVYLMADTCHSADLTRDLEPEFDLRYLPNPRLDGRPRSRRRNIISNILDGYVNADASYPGILFSGCDENGTSADATFAGRSNGAFTHCVIKALTVASFALTNRQLSNKVNIGLKTGCFRQHSHLQCAPVFVDETFLALP